MNWPNNPLSNLLQREIGIFKTIRVASLRRPLSPISVTIQWDQMTEIGVNTNNPNVKASGFSRRTDTCRRLEVDWYEPSEIESWVETVGWLLGSGYLYRWSKPPCDNPTAPGSGLGIWFGQHPYSDPVAGEFMSGQSCGDLMDEAGSNGSWQWEINSAWMKGSDDCASKLFFPAWRKNDRSLSEDGSRTGDFSGWKHDKWLRLAKEFETTDEPNHALQISYDYTKMKMNPWMK